jgi:hypothetical protein
MRSPSPANHDPGLNATTRPPDDDEVSHSPIKRRATESKVQKGETDVQQFWRLNSIDLRRLLKAAQSDLLISQAKYTEVASQLQEQQGLLQQLISPTQARVETYGTVEEMSQFVTSLQEQVNLLVSRRLEQ